MKLTEWYSGDQKPVRVGMYQTTWPCTGAVLWRYWNGKFWGWGYENKVWAYRERNAPNGLQNSSWRGIAK